MKLRILTYNIYFEPVAMDLRMQAIGRIVERLRPAVVGFQEVTRESLAMLKKQRWTRFYDCSVDIAPPFSEAYFVVLFSALPVLALETLPFANSGMGRELVAMRVEVAPGKSLLVGTSHLESMPQFARARVAQLNEAMRFLQERVVSSAESSRAARTECLGAVFMGDTNLLHSDLKLMDTRVGAAVADLDIEHAKTGRSKCRVCGEAIEKDAIRVGRTARDQLPNGQHLTLKMWFHEQCFLAQASHDERQVVESYSSQRLAVERSAGSSTAATAAHAPIDLATLGLPPNWKDLWLTLEGNTDENGCTFDGKVNALVASKAFRSRLDRMFFYPGASVREAFNASSSAVLDALHIVGREPISDKLWPSDHFGLLATFDFDSAQQSTRSDTTTPAAPARSAAAAAAGAAALARAAQASAPERKVKAEHATDATAAAASSPPKKKKTKAGSTAATAVTIE